MTKKEKDKLREEGESMKAAGKGAMTLGFFTLNPLIKVGGFAMYVAGQNKVDKANKS